VGRAQKKHESDFKGQLNDLFDVAQKNVLVDPKVLEEEKQF